LAPDAFSGLKFSVLGIFTSLNRFLCRSAGIGAEKENSELFNDNSPLQATLLCGAFGATTKKNGFSASAASSRSPYAFEARISVEYSPG